MLCCLKIVFMYEIFLKILQIYFIQTFLNILSYILLIIIMDYRFSVMNHFTNFWKLYGFIKIYYLNENPPIGSFSKLEESSLTNCGADFNDKYKDQC